MKTFTPLNTARLALLFLLGTLVIAIAWPLLGIAQDKANDPQHHGQHSHKLADASKDLAAQIAELRVKFGKLEQALTKMQHDKSTGANKGMSGMGMMSGMHGMLGGMPGMSGSQGMAGMSGDQGMSGMGMMDEDMDMMGMMGMSSPSKGMKGMAGMKMASALPGFPGASHIYHIGATGFFLDHPEHITLSAEQQMKLNQAKRKALLDKSKMQLKIDEAEQELWELTGSDEPDANKIQAKVQEIEKKRGEQRLAFIRAVGEVAKVLTEEQRKALLGTAAPHSHQH